MSKKDLTPTWAKRIEIRLGARQKTWWMRYKFSIGIGLLLGVLFIETLFLFCLLAR